MASCQPNLHHNEQSSQRPLHQSSHSALKTRIQQSKNVLTSLALIFQLQGMLHMLCAISLFSRPPVHHKPRLGGTT